MNRATGHYFDARSLAASPVEFWCADGHFHVQSADSTGEVRRWPLAVVRVSERLGSVPRFLYLPNEASIEASDNESIDMILAIRDRSRIPALVHWLEQRSQVAVAATVLLLAAMAAILSVGLPMVARAAALRVPEDIERQAGDTALRSFGSFLRPSGLTEAERGRVTDRSAALARELGLPQPRIEFRDAGQHANAFALPGGTIIVTDALVRLANTPELEAVLLHEFAHWQLRHGLQSILRGSAALLVVSAVTGDLSTLTAFASTIPLTLLQRGYSREFEAEADDYALAAMRRTGRDPRHLAAILAKLQRQAGGGQDGASYLGTHPSTGDRLLKADPEGTAADLPPSDEVFFFAALDEPPVALAETGPPESGDFRASGVVAIEYTIATDGTTADVTVVRSLDSASDEAARAAVASWRYRPGRKDGAIAATRASATLLFRPGRRPVVYSGIGPAGGSEGAADIGARASDRTTPPQPISTPDPLYPEHLRIALTEGTVLLEYTVDHDGRVHDVNVLRSSHPEFELPAKNAVLSWVFTPGRKNGRIVSTRVKQEIRFHLNEGEAPATVHQSVNAETELPAPSANVAQLLNGLQRPEPVSLVAPVTPLALGGRKGDVIVRFFVTIDGDVVDAIVLSSSDKMLEAPALAAVRRWQFSPQPQVSDARVRFEMRWKVHFGHAAGHAFATPLPH